ncbi:MAG TPA: hypothetical protein DEP36_02455 [Gammaproteobacteria bacterium]|nr:hypothetical protein [Gammaproteobacteria bacterium]
MLNFLLEKTGFFPDFLTGLFGNGLEGAQLAFWRWRVCNCKLRVITKLNMARRHLNQEQRSALWVDMRKDGMSYRQIAETDKTASKDTIKRAVENSGVWFDTPAVTGKDGKEYPRQVERKADWPGSPGKSLPRTWYQGMAVSCPAGNGRSRETHPCPQAEYGTAALESGTTPGIDSGGIEGSARSQ